MTLLKFNESLADHYRNKSQRTRVMSESWIGQNAYCIACGGGLNQYANNNPASDFYCSACAENFELKSKRGKSLLITDGAYQPMVDKIRKNEAPNFFLLRYTEDLYVSDVAVIPRHFLTETIILMRKPLSSAARRAGWVGCNIDLKQIPEDGKINLVKNSTVVPKRAVLEKYQKTSFLREYSDLKNKRWTLEIMKCLDRLRTRDFNLDSVYAFEPFLQKIYPNNKHIRDKIRQQLQILRDNGYIEFLGRGTYRRR